MVKRLAEWNRSNQEVDAMSQKGKQSSQKGLDPPIAFAPFIRTAYLPLPFSHWRLRGEQGILPERALPLAERLNVSSFLEIVTNPDPRARSSLKGPHVK